jgi:hypothetical protein
MLAHCRATPHAVDLSPTLRDLAGAADQVKFARGSVLLDEAERHLTATRDLIKKLESRLRPVASEGGAPA